MSSATRLATLLQLVRQEPSRALVALKRCAAKPGRSHRRVTSVACDHERLRWARWVGA
jgi:hypothetical protein